MAATITLVQSAGKQPMAPTFARRLTVLGDVAYVAGGYSLGLATSFPNDTVVAVVAQPFSAAPRTFEFDYATGKLKFLVAATGAEVAGASDQSAVTATVLVITK